MERETTQIDTNIGAEVTGYVILDHPFNLEDQARIRTLQDYFPDGTWPTPPELLHVTLMDWLAPLIAYQSDKDELFEEIYPTYDAALSELLAAQPAITVQFSEVRVTPDAIILVGTDDGSIARLREGFLKRVPLIPGTKPLPTIIHSTIARFQQEIPFSEVQDSLKEVSFEHDITSFKVIRMKQNPLLEYEVVKEYPLSGN